MIYYNLPPSRSGNPKDILLRKPLRGLSYDGMVEEIIAFVDERKGRPDHVVHDVRRVLETHYRRAYSACFGRDRKLRADRR